MIKFRLLILLYLLLSFTPCHGQVQTDLPPNVLSQPKTILGGQPKLIKTQGTNQYANVRAGLQTKDGNLWFATMGEGVYRFDGKHFTQFTTKDGLSSNKVWAIVEDKTGKLWFGTDEGLCQYDPSTHFDSAQHKSLRTSGKTITHIPIIIAKDAGFLPSFSLNPSSHANIWSMLRDSKGTLWLGTSEGVYCYDGEVFTRFLDQENIINKNGVRLNSIQYLFEDKKGNIWFGPGASQVGAEGLEGLCCYDGKTITSFKPNGDGWIRYIVEDKSGVIWFGTRSNGNWRYDPSAYLDSAQYKSLKADGKTFAKYTDKVNIGAPILVDHNGNIWFSGEEHDNGYASNGGIWRYDGKSFKNFTTKDGIGHYSVWSINEDRAGNIWFGTRNIGLYRYDPSAELRADGKTFTHFSE